MKPLHLGQETNFRPDFTEFVFSLFNIAKMPCICAVELTAVGNPVITGACSNSS